MPLFHVGGIVRNLFAPILSGGSVMMCSGFDATQFWTLAVERGITWCVVIFLALLMVSHLTHRYYAAPTMHQAILSSIPEHVIPSRDTHIRLVCNAAGGLLPTLAEQLKATFGAIILPSYGSTVRTVRVSSVSTRRSHRDAFLGMHAYRKPANFVSARTPGMLGDRLRTLFVYS